MQELEVLHKENFQINSTVTLETLSFNKVNVGLCGSEEIFELLIVHHLKKLIVRI